MPPLRIEDLGRRDYAEALRLQHELVAARAAGAIDDRVLLVEHPSVYTAGRGTRTDGTRAEDVLDPGAAIVAVERGGRVTWHGPGQLVVYPIVQLVGPQRDLHRWLRRLEDLAIAMLAAFGLSGERDPRGTGVFVAPATGGAARKIASIGIAVRHWVTFHGLALNVDPDLAAFARIKPCGFDAAVMTSLTRELGRPVSMDEARAAARAALAAPPWRDP